MTRSRPELHFHVFLASRADVAAALSFSIEFRFSRLSSENLSKRAPRTSGDLYRHIYRHHADCVSSKDATEWSMSLSFPIQSERKPNNKKVDGCYVNKLVDNPVLNSLPISIMKRVKPQVDRERMAITYQTTRVPILQCRHDKLAKKKKSNTIWLQNKNLKNNGIKNRM